MTEKLSEQVRINITFEMRQWLERMAAEGGTDRSSLVRSILQSVMDDDLRENEAKAA